VRDYVKSELANAILKNFPEAEAISGVATAGIAHGALAADLLKLPFTYVRSKPKDHGLANLIEGVLETGQKVVVVEDLVSTGKSSLEAVQSLRNAGAEVIGMCALFTYGFPQAEEAFAKAQVPLITMSNYNELMQVAIKSGIVQDDERLHQWQLNPSTWGYL
jgi:orotate phosphoribosyltransferase